SVARPLSSCCPAAHPAPPSFPTRRSSDLAFGAVQVLGPPPVPQEAPPEPHHLARRVPDGEDQPLPEPLIQPPAPFEDQAQAPGVFLHRIPFTSPLPRQSLKEPAISGGVPQAKAVCRLPVDAPAL